MERLLEIGYGEPDVAPNRMASPSHGLTSALQVAVYTWHSSTLWQA